MSIKSFVNNHDQYLDFLLFLDKRIEEVRVALESAKDYEIIRHLQGQIFMLKRLKSMREEVNGTN